MKDRAGCSPIRPVSVLPPGSFERGRWKFRRPLFGHREAGSDLTVFGPFASGPLLRISRISRVSAV